MGKDYYAKGRLLLMCSKRISTHKECPKTSVRTQSSCKVLKTHKNKEISFSKLNLLVSGFLMNN